MNKPLACLIAGVFAFCLPAAANPILDAGFESPTLVNPSYQYNPTGTPWTFASAAGVICGSSTNYGVNGFGNTPAPEGSQVAFIQAPAPGAAASSISQTITGLAPGTTYTLSFDEEGRNYGGGADPIEVLLDGAVIVAAHSPASVAAYDVDHTDFSTPTAGPHTLTFLGLAPNQAGSVGGDPTDKTTFIDDVQIAVTPEPVSLLPMLLPTALLLSRRASACRRLP